MGIGFNSQYHYYKIMAEVDYYHSLWKNVILATKLKSGIIKPVQGDLFAPIEDRFLMGGAQSLTGLGTKSDFTGQPGRRQTGRKQYAGG